VIQQASVWFAWRNHSIAMPCEITEPPTRAINPGKRLAKFKRQVRRKEIEFAIGRIQQEFSPPQRGQSTAYG